MSNPYFRKFEGLLTYVNRVSSKPPTGCKDSRLFIPKNVAEQALETLKFSPINYDHTFNEVVGIITDVYFDDDRIMVKGHVFTINFPEYSETSFLASEFINYGMSFEARDVFIEDINAPVAKVEKMTFTGACFAPKDKIAYKGTWFKFID